MHKGNPEILRFEVALQDFAEFTIVIHNEQMRPELLRRLTGNFGCVRATCALIVHDDSDESLLNQERPAQTKPKEEIAFPELIIMPCCRQPYDAIWGGPVIQNPS